MKAPASIADFVPEGVESGTGLALQTGDGRYLFFLAGNHHHCPSGQIFYAGIGGHRETGETWIECVQREARVEIGVAVDIQSAAASWYIPHEGEGRQLTLSVRPRPLALYEMIHPPLTPNEGQLYRLVIYQARLRNEPATFPPDEIAGLIALTKTQVILGLQGRPALSQLLDEGASLIAGVTPIDPHTRLYPIGTAAALGTILHWIDSI